MKCILKRCDNEATLPFYACSREHGYEWNQIKSAILNETRSYKDSPFSSFSKWLTEEEINFYKERI